MDYAELCENLDLEVERLAALLNLPGKTEVPEAKASARQDRRQYGEVMGHEEEL